MTSLVNFWLPYLPLGGSALRQLMERGLQARRSSLAATKRLQLVWDGDVVDWLLSKVGKEVRGPAGCSCGRLCCVTTCTCSIAVHFTTEWSHSCWCARPGCCNSACHTFDSTTQESPLVLGVLSQVEMDAGVALDGAKSVESVLTRHVGRALRKAPAVPQGSQSQKALRLAIDPQHQLQWDVLPAS
jgi:hypothetical protein